MKKSACQPPERASINSSLAAGSQYIEIPQSLRTFARKSSNIDFLLRILPLKADELVILEMQKNWGVTSFVLEKTVSEEHLNLRKSGFVSEEDQSGCKSQNIAIRVLKANVLCQI